MPARSALTRSSGRSSWLATAATTPPRAPAAPRSSEGISREPAQPRCGLQYVSGPHVLPLAAANATVGAEGAVAVLPGFLRMLCPSNLMTTTTTRIEDFKENAELVESHAPAEAIHVEVRKPTLRQFLRTVVKTGGSDLHLQAESAPMIRVDGRPRFLDSPPPTNEEMEGFTKEIITDPDKMNDLHHRGSSEDRKSTRLNSSHSQISYAVFCL